VTGVPGGTSTVTVIVCPVMSVTWTRCSAALAVVTRTTAYSAAAAKAIESSLRLVIPGAGPLPRRRHGFDIRCVPGAEPY
jgi:hypothetical protein